MEQINHLLSQRFPFFEDELRDEIEQYGQVQEIGKDDEILREGQYIKSFPMVLEGSLRVIRHDDEGNELLLYFLKPGDVCSMALTCCMGQQQSNISALADENSVLLRIPIECLDKWMMQYPSWKTYMMYAYRKRFDELLETIDAIAFMDLDQRLELFLRSRFKATGEKIFSGTHQDIAYQLNTSREVVSRLLKKMEEKGLVKLGRAEIDFSGLIAREL
ncbi:Crp/Fnr family transcriptional regulator [Gaoshiqia sediminis]|uniref:Crp/Fnr family transcriptional regulator n=1 Tax=Gaoshiqia sediminis TaxID=2986998 RepID=A0AA41Y7Q0_9BACT|nr:Crp/Fnr family transcriptional regulator [Gaoshiqia sediminis]MCW0483390.1 Crp/Fnr family transcriptional regulator [Gaoshiqia sediminis]